MNRVRHGGCGPSGVDLRPIYGIDVGSFRDGDGDGMGDLQGVMESLHHVEKLGAGWVWLLPFYPSPLRDNGYDVTDYYGVNPRFGSLGDFVDLVAEARRRNLRVLIDLVINHTSDEHPWFQAARANPDGPFRNYYCWTDHPPPLERQPRPIFPDRVPSVWTWDEQVGAFFYHQFYPFQPSLNHQNPAVQDEVRRILEFWMALGVTAFRIDAAGHLGQPQLEPGSDGDIDILRRYRSYVGDEATLLGEADLVPQTVGRLLGADRLQLLFDFVGNNYLYLAFARESAEPIVRALDLHGPAPDGTAWVHFLRNLDEVDLERLSGDERDLVLGRFAPERRMRIFERGIRRRLATMLEGDPRRLRLAFAILLAHPGVPMIVYGDEIGMGDDQRLPERKAVRTAMQWTAEPGVGFSDAPEDEIRVPILRDGPYAAEHVNVAAQEDDEGSLLRFVRRAIAARAEVVRPSAEIRAVGDDRVLATCASVDGGTAVTLANLSSQSIRVERFWGEGTPQVRLGMADGLVGADHAQLEPYGVCWFTVRRG